MKGTATGPTAALAEFAAALRFDDIPADVIAHMKLCLLDTLGCGLFGATRPWSRILSDCLTSIGGSGPCVVWGTDDTLGRGDAALGNGAAVHAFEFDDLHARAILHPGSVVAPAVMASLEPCDGSGRALLRGLVVGYEVGARVGMAAGAAHLLRGWHPTGTHGAVAAAAGAGAVLNLTTAQMANCLGIAAAQSAGLMGAQYGAMAKRFHAGRAAQSGVYAASLAGRGYTGIDDVFDDGYGRYSTTFAPGFEPAALATGLGERWETRAVGFKPYPTNGSCHPTIDALMELRSQLGLVLRDVERVDVRVSSATKEHVGWKYVPDSVTTAQMNLPYIVAVVLADGEASASQFDDAHLGRPDLVEAAERVYVHSDPEIDARGDGYRHHTVLTITLTNGKTVSATREHARGSAKEPLSEREVHDKYQRLAGEALPPGQVAALAETVTHLDEGGRVSDLASLLRRPPS